MLTPPKNKQWWELTESDFKIFEDSLRSVRLLHNGSKLADLHFFMRRIGLHTDLTDDDIADVKVKLKDDRKRQLGFSLAWTLSKAKELGINENVTTGDRKLITTHLDGLVNDGMNYLDTFYHLRMLGQGGDIPERGLGLVLSDLRMSRRIKNGWVLARMHYLLKMIGHPQEVIPSDISAMKTNMNLSRQRGDGDVVAAMHLYISSILGEPEKTMDEMPPLKKIT